MSPAPTPDAPDASRPKWTLLSNHAHILICLAENPRRRLRDIAERVGITERGVQKILAELEGSGLVDRRREGRRNVYGLHLEQALRHPLEAHCTADDLVNLVLARGRRDAEGA